MNLMEGQIWIESEGLGRGSTAIFIVKLGTPGRSNESKLPFVHKGPGNQEKPNFSGLKVVVMDDNRLVIHAPFITCFLFWSWHLFLSKGAYFQPLNINLVKGS